MSVNGQYSQFLATSVRVQFLSMSLISSKIPSRILSMPSMNGLQTSTAYTLPVNMPLHWYMEL